MRLLKKVPYLALAVAHAACAAPGPPAREAQDPFAQRCEDDVRRARDASLNEPDRPRPDTSRQSPSPGQRLSFGATTVNGRLHPKRIQTVVRSHFEDFQSCLPEVDSQLAGRVTTRFVIGRSGVVSNVGGPASLRGFPCGVGGPTRLGGPCGIADDSLDPDIVACFHRVFSRMCFPSPEGGIVTVVYPIGVEPLDSH
jgi:hypothetical protein